MIENYSLKKPFIITTLVLVVLFGALLVWNFIGHLFMKRYFANFQPPPVAVSSTKPVQKDWQNYLTTVGVLRAVNGVNVSTDASGLVTKIYFESGQSVNKGDPLIQLDDRIDQENLKNFQAELKLAQLTNERLRSLLQKKATSQAELDRTQATLKQAQANVAKTEVLIEQKKIQAPFGGKLGIRVVDLGEYISPGASLVSLQSIAPLYLNFSLPEQYLKKLYPGQTVKLSIDAYKDKVFEGKINAIDSKADSKTHNIQVQATVPNKDEQLYPGLFADIKIMLPIRRNVVIVPQTAVSYSLYGDSVFVIKEDGKDKAGKPNLTVMREYVTVGDRFGNQVVIEKGLKSGENIVTSGQLKLQNKTRVTINNSVKLD